MNNEPVAWMCNTPDVCGGRNDLDVLRIYGCRQCSPLYTHPGNAVTDSDFDAALRQRDNYHAAADSLAAAIGDYFGIDIGEHSSANDPWSVALEHIESAHPAKTLTDDAQYDRGFDDGCKHAEKILQAEIKALKNFIRNRTLFDVESILRKAQDK